MEYMKKNVIIIFLFFIVNVNGMASSTYYMSPYGVDKSSCETSRENNPWETLQALKDRCLSPGDTVIFLQGIYDDKNILNGNVGVNRIVHSQKPIYLRSQKKEGNNWPVKFVGDGFNITTGGPISISGIEFIKKESERNNQAIIAIGISNVSLKNNYIHGSKPQLNKIQLGLKSRDYDCIYAPANKKGVENIEIINNIIKDCSQDAIDLPGTKNVLISENEISNALQIQIKGGAENIYIVDNKIHSMIYGFVGGTMKCPYYCGSLYQTKIIVKDRFNAKNINIINNEIYDIKNNWIVNFTGWENVLIKGNVVDQSSILNTQEIFSSRNWYTQFYDEMANKYCFNNYHNCKACAISSDGSCVSIYIPPRNILITGNDIKIKNQLMLRVVDRNNSELSNICIDSSNNINKEGRTSILYEDHQTQSLYNEKIINTVTTCDYKREE